MKSTVKKGNKIRLQLFLSRNGICSRREAMRLIQAGRVKLNGEIHHEPSTVIDPGKDIVEFKGKAIKAKEYEYLLLNKPAGFITTKKDRHAAKTVFDLLPKGLSHLLPVGRLDKETEGLLLFTNDGDLAHQLTHPRFNIKKTYFVIIRGGFGPPDKKKLENGIFLDGKKTAPAKMNIEKISNDTTQLTMTIHEGRKRQIRLMFDKIGKKVVYLKRVTQGPLTLGGLKRGQWRHLTADELKSLKS